MSTVTLTGDDYQYRFAVEAKQRFIDSLRERFNAGVTYKGRILKWDTVIQEKASELGQCLSGRSRGLDLIDPAPILERTDNRLIREKILSLTKSEAKKRGIVKSTLHYLQRNAKTKESFRIYGKIRTKLVEDHVP